MDFKKMSKAQLERYIKDFPNDLNGYIRLAGVCERNEEKKAVFERYIQKNPNEFLGYAYLADVCETPEDKKAVWERCIQKLPNALAGYVRLAGVCERNEEKKAVWERYIQNNPNDLNGYGWLADVCETNEEKKEVFKRCIQNNPNKLNGYVRLASVCEATEEREDIKLKYIMPIEIKDGLKNENISNYADYENKRNEFLGQINIDQDIETLKQNVKQDPHRFIDSYKLATAYHAAGDTANETLVWIEFIEKNSNNIMGYLELGRAGEPAELIDAMAHYYFRNLWDNDAANIIDRLRIEDIYNHIDSLPNTFKGCIYRQAACFFSLDYEGAAQNWETYLENDPNNYYALINCGECFAIIKEVTRAAEIYGRAFEAAPDKEAKLKVIEKQEDLRKDLNENERAELEQQIKSEREELNPQQVQQQAANNNQVREQVGMADVVEHDVGRRNIVPEQQAPANNAAQNHQHNAQMQRN